MSACVSPSIFNDTDLLSSVFDALPLPALVVDADVRIIDFNLAAARLLENLPFAVLRPSGGEALACIHSAEVPEGCGHAEACPDCVIRNSVRDAFDDIKSGRKVTRMQLMRGGRTVEVDFLVSVSPIPNESEPLALLVLDDARELSRLLDSRPPATPASFSRDSRARAKVHAHKTDNN